MANTEEFSARETMWFWVPIRCPIPFAKDPRDEVGRVMHCVAVLLST